MEALHPKNGTPLEPVITDFSTSTKGIKFKKEVLVGELLSLNNPKITQQIATLIGEEVEKEIHRRRIQYLSSELISELVEGKLEELGLIRQRSQGQWQSTEKKDEGQTKQNQSEGLSEEILEAMVSPGADEKLSVHSTPAPSLKKIPVELSKNALEVLKRRYLIKNDKGEIIETPEELFSRVARAVAAADVKYDPHANLKEREIQFYNLMASGEFIPNSPTLANAGRSLGQLSACFVLPIYDSMESIFETMKQAAIIHKSGGGTGFTFTHLRPKNDRVQSTHGISSGPISFMKVYNSATEAVKQGGTRRGANMGILNITHPDILEFTSSKEKTDQLTNFNISIGLSAQFMDEVENDEMFSLINPRSGEVVKKIKARKLFRKIVRQACKTGEPGVLFLDRIEAANPTPKEGRLEATNPCGEQPLLPYESCNLGSVNLGKVVVQGTINWGQLKGIVQATVHFLDNIIEINHYPLTEIEETVKRNRKIGLGVMGWADMLIKLGIPYCSDEAVDLACRVMGFVQKEAEAATVDLAGKRGVFPNYNESIFAERGLKRRNATVTTIAPTGTISMIADCSSGIEPLYALAYIKKVMGGKKFLYINRDLEGELRKHQLFTKEIIKEVIEEGTVAEIAQLPQETRDLFVTSFEVAPEWHIKMQAAFQKHTENAVSKTCNLPASATEADVDRIYWLAYKSGCKGVTVYRDTSRDPQ